MRSGISSSSSKLAVIVRPLPPRTAGAHGAVAHPKASPHASCGVLVVLDSVAESLGHVVGCLGHVVILQQSEQSGVGGSVTADGGLQADERKVMRGKRTEPDLHVSDNRAMPDDGELLHPNPPHHLHAGHAGPLAPHWRQVEAIVVQLLQGVGRHLPLHQLSELTDVQTTLAQPGKNP